MRPDLPQTDFDGLVRRHDELARAKRALQRTDGDREEARGSPFELMVEVAQSLFTMFVIAIVAVALVAYALSDIPVPKP